MSIFLSFFLIGNYRSNSIKALKESVILGQGSPSVWIYYDSATMGTSYGKRLRASERLKSVGLILQPFLPEVKNKTLVIGNLLPSTEGRRMLTAIRDCRKLILLNPRFSPNDAGITLDEQFKVKVYFGEFSQSPTIESWRKFASFKQISNSGDFLPDWAKIISAQ